MPGNRIVLNPASLARPRVVIADPSTAVIQRLVSAINDVADIVGSATNSHDALHNIRSGNPHLTVFDVALPNGVQLLREIKNHQPPVIIVVLTHSVEDTTRDYCLRLGAEYFLDKIHDFHKVRDLVIGIGNGWDRTRSGPAGMH